MCDELLHSLFRVKTINMFQMNKALTKHIWPLGDGDGNFLFIILHLQFTCGVYDNYSALFTISAYILHGLNASGTLTLDCMISIYILSLILFSQPLILYSLIG